MDSERDNILITWRVVRQWPSRASGWRLEELLSASHIERIRSVPIAPTWRLTAEDVAFLKALRIAPYGERA
jgi:hypothetical protein